MTIGQARVTDITVHGPQLRHLNKLVALAVMQTISAVLMIPLSIVFISIVASNASTSRLQFLIGVVGVLGGSTGAIGGCFGIEGYRTLKVWHITGDFILKLIVIVVNATVLIASLIFLGKYGFRVFDYVHNGSGEGGLLRVLIAIAVLNIVSASVHVFCAISSVAFMCHNWLCVRTAVSPGAVQSVRPVQACNPIYDPPPPYAQSIECMPAQISVPTAPLLLGPSPMCPYYYSYCIENPMPPPGMALMSVVNPSAIHFGYQPQPCPQVSDMGRMTCGQCQSGHPPHVQSGAATSGPMERMALVQRSESGSDEEACDQTVFLGKF